MRDGEWSCLGIYPSSIPSVDMQPALQNDATWKCLLFLLIVARAQNLAGNICSKHRPLPRFESGRSIQQTQSARHKDTKNVVNAPERNAGETDCLGEAADFGKERWGDCSKFEFGVCTNRVVDGNAH